MRVQQELLPQTGCLISFSLNIPGQCKRSPLADRAFQEGRERIRDSVALPGKLLHEVSFDLPTGLETLMVIDSEPGPAKKRALLLEETSPIGRYYDIDIISSSGEKLSRLSLGYPPRRCFLCGQNAFLCRRQQTHTAAALLEKMNSDLRQHFLIQDADEIAGFAQRALLTEAAISPKPGLVDRFSPGAHQDMDFFTFLESASALRPWFQAFALAGLEAPDISPEQIFPRLRTIGLQAEGAMLQATGGINTHKGCIFSLGVLCATMGQIPKNQWTVSALAALAGKIAANALSDFSNRSLSHSHGALVHSLHGTDGIRGEASRGFPSVQNIGLPTLESALRRGASLNDAAAWTLLHLIAQVEDTNILFRGGTSAASRVRNMAAASIDHIQHGLPLHQVLQDLDRSFTAQNLSPGGCADLLALTLFLHFALLPSRLNKGGIDFMTSFMIGCIADDFTGGSDAASFLKKAGLRTVLSDGIPSSFDQITDYDAIVIALKSRTQETNHAVQDSLDALQWLQDHGAQKLYLKYCSTFDSTPTGNIGPVADAAMERFSVPYTILAPALLPNGRTVRDGILFVNGIPLAESHMRHHPLTPMWDSRIAELMRRQSAYPCFPISETFYSDSAALFARISLWQQQYPHFYLVPDDWSPDHGHQIAALFGSLPLLTGGSGLLEDLGALANVSASESLKPPAQDRSPRLMLAGSCSSATQEQVHRWLESGGAGIQLDPNMIRRLGLAPFFEKASQAQEDLLFYSSGSIGALASRSPSPEDAALLEQSMAAIAAHMHRSGKLHRLVVAGGETSGAVMQALHLHTFLIGESIAPGVPEMSPVDTPSLRVILKSGNFGGPDFFLNALKEET